MEERGLDLGMISVSAVGTSSYFHIIFAFIESEQFVPCSPKHFTCIISFNPHTTPVSWVPSLSPLSIGNPEAPQGKLIPQQAI